MPEAGATAPPAWRDTTISHDGLQLAVRMHGAATSPPVIALHGWQDNAASFDLLAPLLPEHRVIAIDLPGHGRSGWRSREAGYYIWSYLVDVLAVADALQLARFSLLGHSMGGAVACLLAATFPERVDRMVLLDAVGPLTTAPEEAPGQMRRALLQQHGGDTAGRHRYPDFAAAVQARAARGLSIEAATLLGKRGIAQDAEGCYWRLDPRLTRANLLSLSEEQAAAFIRQISCPCQLLAAPQYWRERRAWFDRRRGYFAALELHELPGSHHQHLDGQVTEVATLVRRFLGEPLAPS
jgi:pimeloyl-ACP methyl ester carboxylesterase